MIKKQRNNYSNKPFNNSSSAHNLYSHKDYSLRDVMLYYQKELLFIKSQPKNSSSSLIKVYLHKISKKYKKQPFQYPKTRNNPRMPSSGTSEHLNRQDGLSFKQQNNKQFTPNIKNRSIKKQLDVHKQILSIQNANKISLPKNKIKKQSKLLKNCVSQFVEFSQEPREIHNIVCSQYSYYIKSTSKFYDNIAQTLSTFRFLNNVKKPSIKDVKKLNLPKSQNCKGKMTVVLDLDQTLIHCNQNLFKAKDVVLTVKFPTGQVAEAGVNIRPFVHNFLKQASELFEIIVFTASQPCYGNVVIDYLDPQRKYISHRLFREHCYQSSEGIYIKDLRVINRSLSEMVLVDNAAYSYIFQLQNAIPIMPYYFGKTDEQLFQLLNYLKKVGEQMPQIRKYNQQYFKLYRYKQFKDALTLINTLYPRNI